MDTKIPKVLDIKTATVQELQALGYQLMEEGNRISNNLAMIRQELALRVKTALEADVIKQDKPKE